MYFPELAWHNIREFLYGKRPFGFWDWKSSIKDVLKNIKDEYYACYYWSSHQKHYYKDNGELDYNIYTIYTYSPLFLSKELSKKTIYYKLPIKLIFKNKKYCEDFKTTLNQFNLVYNWKIAT